jgi:hypothetical protein
MRNTFFLPPLTAEVSLYQSRGLYRSQRPADRCSGVLPSQLPSGTVSGSFQTTCPPEGCDYNFGFLSCYCFDRNGALQYSSLFVPFCFGDIANCNGVLTCGPCLPGGP